MGQKIEKPGVNNLLTSGHVQEMVFFRNILNIIIFHLDFHLPNVKSGGKEWYKVV